MDITIIPTQDGAPVIEIKGKHFSFKGEDRKGLKNAVAEAALTLENYNIRRVKAYGGEVIPPVAPPAKTMEMLVYFDDIIIRECDGSHTRDPELISKVFFALGLLIWYAKSSCVHFTRVSGTRTFRCIVCGNLQDGAPLAERVPCADSGSIAPGYCTNDTCYSHVIEQALGLKKSHV